LKEGTTMYLMGGEIYAEITNKSESNENVNKIQT
jgi:hypothetical protein